MVYQDKSLFNTRDYCREQILRYLDYYKQENHQEIGESFINSISYYVSRIVYDIHGPHYFCDEIDVEILYVKYVEYKNLDLSQYSNEFIKMLMGYMAKKLQTKVNEFYRQFRDGKYSVRGDNVLSSKDKDMFLRKINNLIEEKPKIIRRI
ncbi:hypothetical protein ACR77J_12090 [Tissierella praeacuta]|uniref:hypothetical protein n=1 Tax=Tissierella praeacuta TaxID=43131 RepID=UPI00104D14B0|nr:hypothetical protein [Tissierella praeacuta]TCU72866.1 hypothetical protein EV204_105202 [Tissierella praeacuta]